MSSGVAPKCECGCGQQVTWKERQKTWNRWVRNHHPQDHSDRGDPWNKGNLQLYKHQCKTCLKEFKNRLKVADFCSRECFHFSTVGAGSVHWKGGEKTKYAHVRDAHGRLRKAHRVIMSAIQGRKLKATEVVHHIDENGLNNTPSNLHLFHCDSCHQHFHKTSAPLKYVYPAVHLTP